MGRNGRTRFEVVVSTSNGQFLTDHSKVAGAQTTAAAFAKVCEIIQQWAASEGAITPGTEVSIVDTRDGGKLFTAAYLGFEVALLGRDPKQWPELREPQRHPLRRFPR